TGASRWKAAATKVPKAGKAGANPFIGNAAGTASASVRYASTATPEGNSLGTWAPVPTTKGVAGAAITRPGISTVTVEIPQWKDPAQAPAIKAIEELDRD